jgi:serine/threonine protein phosphatase 1
VPAGEADAGRPSSKQVRERELAALFPDGHWPDHYTDAEPVAFGHHVVGPAPMVRDGRIFGLDTGACHGGRLTALCVPGFTVHSVAAHADHWSIAKRRWQLPVLKDRDWLDLTWAEVTQTAERFAAIGDSGVRDWLTAVEQWAARLRSLVPVLVAAAERLAGDLTLDQARRHPAARFVFPARNGRSTVARHCTTPRRTIDAAAALGVGAPGLPG